MVSAIQHLPPAERNAVGGYNAYLLGVGMLANPDETRRLHRLDPENDTAGIVERAKAQMILGLSTVIKNSDPDQQGSLEAVAGSYQILHPYMAKVVDLAFDSSTLSEKMDKISPAIEIVRPAPMCVEATFKHICKARRGHLRVGHLMGGVPMDPRFEAAGIPRDTLEGIDTRSLQFDLTAEAARAVEEVERSLRENGWQA